MLGCETRRTWMGIGQADFVCRHNRMLRRLSKTHKTLTAAQKSSFVAVDHDDQFPVF
jgi:hypothetical protein